MDIADNAINLYRLLLVNRGPLSFEEARDLLKLSPDEMHEALDLLKEVMESNAGNLAAGCCQGSGGCGSDLSCS